MSSHDPPNVRVASPPWRSAARLQLVAWLAFAALYFAFDQGRASDVPRGVVLVRTLVWSGVGCGVSTAIAWLHVRRSVRPRPLPWVAAVSIIASVVGGAAWSMSFNALDGAFGIEPGWSPLLEGDQEQLYGEWMDCTLMLLVWHGVVFSFLQLQRTNEQRERALQLEQASTESQLIALRAQLNPHFLFNALNSAMELIHEDAARAERMLQRLADVLRSSLAENRRWIALEDELELVRDYVAIEKVRFEERLNVQWSIDDALRSHSVPAGILLPLVDNAIKHGSRRTEGQLTVEIAAERRGAKVELRVTNSGATHLDPKARPSGLGMGLANVGKRLRAKFGGQATLSLTEDEGRVVAKITMPAQERLR